jgi:hypothetical protein
MLYVNKNIKQDEIEMDQAEEQKEKWQVKKSKV